MADRGDFSTLSSPTSVELREIPGEAFPRLTPDMVARIAPFGAVPNTDWLNGCVELDDRGFILAGYDHAGAPNGSPYATSVPGIFAVGDVRARSVKRVAFIVGEGSVVVHSIRLAGEQSDRPLSHGEVGGRLRMHIATTSRGLVQNPATPTEDLRLSASREYRNHR